MNPAPGRSALACVLTPDGRGAVAVVRVWGRDALAVADAAFRPAQGRRLADTARGRLRLGRMGAGLGDEVVVVVFDGEPPQVEVHSHGGPAPLKLVLAALEAEGAVVRKAEDWLSAEFPSRLAVEAMTALASAPTVRSAEILHDQSEGALEEELRELIAMASSDRTSALHHLDCLIRHSEVGLRLVRGWSAVLAGRPNVGKSRLLNALAGFERVIVDPTPGTTRDVVTVRTAIEGWPVQLEDTAGLRESVDPIEASGVALAKARQAEADLVLLVLDLSERLGPADLALIDAFPKAMRIANKADLPAAWGALDWGCLSVSAERGDGLDALIAALAGRLVDNPPPPGAAVPFLPRHVRLLRHARRWLANGRSEAALGALHRMLGADSNDSKRGDVT
jgi:tRNA modification GTPase